MSWDLNKIYAMVVPFLTLIQCPYTKAEETFGTQALHDLLYYGPNRLSMFDHLQYPGPIPKSFVGVLTLSGLLKVLLWIPYLVCPGIENMTFNKEYILLMSRAVLQVTACIGLYGVGKSVDRWSASWNILFPFKRELQTSKWFFLVMSVELHYSYYVSRTLPSSWSTLLLTFGMKYYLDASRPGHKDVLSAFIGYKNVLRLEMFLVSDAVSARLSPALHNEVKEHLAQFRDSGDPIAESDDMTVTLCTRMICEAMSSDGQKTDDPAVDKALKRRAALICLGILTFTAVVFDIGKVLLLGTVAAQFTFITRRLTLRETSVAITGSALMSVGITIMIDSYFWAESQHAHMYGVVWPEFQGLVHHLLHSETTVPRAPVHWYFTNALPRAVGLPLCIIPFAFVSISGLRSIPKIMVDAFCRKYSPSSIYGQNQTETIVATIVRNMEHMYAICFGRLGILNSPREYLLIFTWVAPVLMMSFTSQKEMYKIFPTVLATLVMISFAVDKFITVVIRVLLETAPKDVSRVRMYRPDALKITRWVFSGMNLTCHMFFFLQSSISTMRKIGMAYAYPGGHLFQVFNEVYLQHPNLEFITKPHILHPMMTGVPGLSSSYPLSVSRRPYWPNVVPLSDVVESYAALPDPEALSLPRWNVTESVWRWMRIIPELPEGQSWDEWEMHTLPFLQSRAAESERDNTACKIHACQKAMETGITSFLENPKCTLHKEEVDSYDEFDFVISEDAMIDGYRLLAAELGYTTYSMRLGHRPAIHVRPELYLHKRTTS